MPATWWARPGTNTAWRPWAVAPVGGRRVELVAAAGSLVRGVGVGGGAVAGGRVLEGRRIVGGVVDGEVGLPPATEVRADRWALMRSTTMNRARNTTSTAAARAVGPGRKLDLPGTVGTNAKRRRRARTAEARRSSPG